MWALVAASLVAVAPGAGSAPASAPTPDAHVRLALGHLTAEVREPDRAYVRYVSLWDVPEKELWTYRRYLGWWVNQMSFERAATVPIEVDASAGRLVWLDLRWYGWNARAWDAVAARDPFTREPWCFHRPAEALRQAAGIKAVVKGDTSPVLAMVNGAWLIRETIETDRSTSYYDLLFARQRFGEHRAEKVPYEAEETVTETRTGYVGGYLREYQVEVKKPVTRYRDAAPDYKVSADFPATVDDWEKAFGVDKLRTFAKETRVDLDFGAVVAGGRDDPKRGSIVALNNRLIVVYPAPFGWAMRSYDVFETSGNKDYSEALIFKDGKFRKGDGADAEFDAGELLAYLPNGGQAGLLINAEGKRVEVATAKAASDSFDRRLNQGVRNVGSCITCHGGGGGFIPPKDEEAEDRKSGIKRKFKDKDQEQRYRAFFDEWVEESKASTGRYEKLVTKTTYHPDMLPGLNRMARPWTGSDVARVTGEVRDAYDGPVDAARAARELGVSLEVFKYLCSRSPKQRPLQLLQGRSIPSRAWEKDVFTQMGLLLDAYRKDPEFEKLFGKE